MEKNNHNSSNRTYPRKQSRGSNPVKVQSIFPNERTDVLKWNGWGHRDSYFYIKDGIMKFNGDRYAICNRDMPYFSNQIKKKLNLTWPVNLEVTDEKIPSDYKYPKSKITEKQLKALQKLNLKMTLDGFERLYRSHGQTNEEMLKVINNQMDRIPDLVMWPECHEDVVEIIKICVEEDIVIIPYGGGTNVTRGLTCLASEERTILSLDMCLMNEILDLDETNLVVRSESGIMGQDLERELNKAGYTIGHEPDSIEFSSLGGWVSTRASGMKKNAYGNIEDIVVHVRMATPCGVLEKGNRVPRMSSGPDFNHLILGSEGSFGVITEVTIKIRPLPECSKYGSLIFPDFKSGVKCLREIARQRCQPASLRLLDNDQFQFGASLRKEPSYFQHITDSISKFYLTEIKGIDLNKMAVATIKYEGYFDVVYAQEKKVNSIASQYGGTAAGATTGEIGYKMTYAIAYIRDWTLKFDNIYSDSFETSAPWDKVLSLIKNVEDFIANNCKKYRITDYVLMYRLAQVYEAGACVYFYFVLNSAELKDHFGVCENIVHLARDVIIESGGSISHHHGVGKVRKKWYKQSVSPVGLEIFNACKAKLDPNNIFASNFVNDKF